MTVTLWELPAPATTVHSATIKELSGRLTRLSISLIVLRDGVDVIEHHDISFEGTECFTCTYMTSLTSEMIRLAYGKLIDLGKTALLDQKAAKSKKSALRHLMICFDDGPCYEVVCKEFSHSTR
jgi:hypothetical protein